MYKTRGPGHEICSGEGGEGSLIPTALSPIWGPSGGGLLMGLGLLTIISFLTCCHRGKQGPAVCSLAVGDILALSLAVCMHDGPEGLSSRDVPAPPPVAPHLSVEAWSGRGFVLGPQPHWAYTQIYRLRATWIPRTSVPGMQAT